jgi:hypothetical protein
MSDRIPHPFRVKELEEIRENNVLEVVQRLLDTIDWYDQKYEEACIRMSNARYELDWNWTPEEGYKDEEIPVLGEEEE